jgi:hypothetical protein
MILGNRQRGWIKGINMPKNNENRFILYQDENGITNVSVRFNNEDLWLTQNQLAEIYDTTKQNVSLHIQNILADNELPGNSVVKEFLTTAAALSRRL